LPINELNKCKWQCATPEELLLQLLKLTFKETALRVCTVHGPKRAVRPRLNQDAVDAFFSKIILLKARLRDVSQILISNLISSRSVTVFGFKEFHFCAPYSCTQNLNLCDFNPIFVTRSQNTYSINQGALGVDWEVINVGL